MEEENILSLQALLDQNEATLDDLQKERIRLKRQLKKALYKKTVVSAEVRKLAENAGPMDNEFFIKLAEDPEVIEEIISTVLGIKIRVVSTTPEYTLTNIGSRGVRLDSFAEIQVEAELLEDCDWGKKGAIVDIEIQKEDKGDHEFRVYYNGATMIINRTPKNTDFADLPRAIVIFISGFDVFGDGEMFYENGKFDKKSLKPRRSPVAEYYINTENLEKESASSNMRMRKISALMRTFRDPEYYDEQFPAFSQRKRILHETEEGVTEVGKEMQLIIDAQAEKVREEQTVENLKSIKETLKLTTQQAMDAMRIPSEQQSRYARMV